MKYWVLTCCVGWTVGIVVAAVADSMLGVRIIAVCASGTIGVVFKDYWGGN